MKTFTFYLAAMIIGINLFANPVDSTVAKTVAKNYYTEVTHTKAGKMTLAYIETAGDDAIYYVFNNNDDGFVVVSADDAALPVLCYSLTGHYVKDDQPGQFVYWMDMYKRQFVSIKEKNLKATPEIKGYWQQYRSNNQKKEYSQVL